MNVLVIGKAKTGTTVISTAILHSIPGAIYHLEPKAFAYFDDPGFDRLQNVVKLIFEHWSATPTLRAAVVRNEARMKFDRVVAIVRDIRDETISRLYYQARHVPLSGPDDPRIGQWLAVLRRKESAPGELGMLDMIRSFNTIFGENMRAIGPIDAQYVQFVRANAARLHVLRYEDFMSGRVDALAAYLGVPLSPRRDVGKLAYTRRTADFDNWKRFILAREVPQLRQAYRAVLEAGGYADWELDDEVRVDPRAGTAYVRRLFDLNLAERAVGALADSRQSQQPEGRQAEGEEDREEHQRALGAEAAPARALDPVERAIGREVDADRD